MLVAKLNSDAFCTSIEKALADPPDTNSSIIRIQNTLNGLPDGKLYINHQGSKVNFLTVKNGRLKYVSKNSSQIYTLARRRYQMTLLEILKLSASSKQSDIERRRNLIILLQKFISACGQGNLDIARIVLTSSQYKWLTGNFVQKRIDESIAFQTTEGILVRSMAERDIINKCEAYAVPLHYEERLTIFVKPLVDELYEELKQKGLASGQVYSYANGNIHWNVPSELEWMNSRGSVWKSYNPSKGEIAIYNDIRSMFADGSLFLWEHEGMMKQFGYRMHSSERASILKYTGTVSKSNFLETYTHEINKPEKIAAIIEQQILPRLWF